MRLTGKKRNKEKKQKVSQKAGISLEQLIPSQNVGATFPKAWAEAAGTVCVLLSQEQEMPTNTIWHDWGGCSTS